MYKTKLCLGVMNKEKISTEDQIKLYKKIGFDGFFTQWSPDISKFKKLADELNMIYQSVHAPFLNADKMWGNDAEAKAAVEELLLCLRDCSEADVPILVVHPYIGFEDKKPISDSGIRNFRTVADFAKAKNVKIAFENVEGEEYLDALMSEFSGYDNVGFCWDSGHELCYNKGKDMLAVYGNRLIATHINDNLGISNSDGKIYWTDDLHLLPFDGITDWQNVAHRLNKCGYNGIITLELTRFSKPDRYENDKYSKLRLEEYVSECYARACRLAYMKNGMDN